MSYLYLSKIFRNLNKKDLEEQNKYCDFIKSKNEEAIQLGKTKTRYI